LPLHLETVKSLSDAVMSEITPAGNLMLVHNTFADRDTINTIRQRKSLFWCLCPNSNLYIENELPPLKMLIDEGCEIVIGTDSLASNNSLSILSELKTLQNNFPSVTLEELVRFGTHNGALALGEEDRYGTIETGKNPGLLLIQNVDLVNMKLLPESYVSRLV
jgi:cytosine/adenosine deaminase-related metal-dependent hydrolase